MSGVSNANVGSVVDECDEWCSDAGRAGTNRSISRPLFVCGPSSFLGAEVYSFDPPLDAMSIRPIPSLNAAMGSFFAGEGGTLVMNGFDLASASPAGINSHIRNDDVARACLCEHLITVDGMMCNVENGGKVEKENTRAQASSRAYVTAIRR